VSQISVLLLLVLLSSDALSSSALRPRERTAEKVFQEALEFEKRGELGNAIARFSAAAQAFEDRGEREGTARALVRLAHLQVLAGKPAEARTHLPGVFDTLNSLSLPRLKAEALLAQGWLEQATSHFAEARKAFSEALETAQSERDRMLESRAQNGFGWSEFLLGNREQAVAAFESAAAIGRHLQDPLLEGEALGGLAAVQRDMDLKAAFASSKKADELIRKSGNQYYLAQAVYGLGVAYHYLGDAERALRCFHECLALKERIGDEGKSSVLLAIGAVHAAQEDWPAALQAFREAEKIAVKAQNRDLLSRIYNNIGTVLHRQGEYRQGADTYREGLKAAEGSPEMQALLQGNLTLALVELPDAEISPKEVAGLIEASERLGLPHLSYLAYAASAREAERHGNFRDAERFFERAISLIEGKRSELFTASGRARYLQTKLYVYEGYISFLFDRSKSGSENQWTAKAFDISERAKARSLLETLPEARRHLDEQLPEPMRRRKEGLLAAISGIQRQLIGLGGSSSERQNLMAELQKAEDGLDNLLSEMRMKRPRQSEILYPRFRRLTEIQRVLEPGEVFLSFIAGDKHSFAWALTQTGISMRKLPKRKFFEEKVGRFREQVTLPSRRPGNLPDVSETARELYAELIGPLVKDLSKITSLIIAPDGLLHYFPFEALRDKNRYLIETVDVSYVSSGSVLLALREAGRRGDNPRYDVLAVGSPRFPWSQEGLSEPTLALRDFYLERGLALSHLPHAEIEIAAISSFFGDGAHVQLGSLATEDWIKQTDLTRYRYLHFATHGLADEKMPDRSALVFSMPSGENEDGLLQTREIMDLKLGADLVVLSGCSTGLGRLIRGEGILGLSQSFLYAGAPSVVVSLWNVSDRSTAEFMKLFYERLSEGLSKTEALREAKLAMLGSERPAWRHPFFWAPFVLVGRAD
jgi:CHAT domain-containing protein